MPLLAEARGRYKAIAQIQGAPEAARMGFVCLSEQGDCLRALGQLDAAADAYEESIGGLARLGDERGVAVGHIQLGTVRRNQGRYSEALASYAQARDYFTRLDDPGSIATIWHQTGIAYQQAGEPEAAEDAYRQSLAINMRLGKVAGQASTLSQLGILYDLGFGHLEETAKFFSQAADKYAGLPDQVREGKTRSNLSEALRKLRRLDEARQQICRAIDCFAQLGYTTELWRSWSILANIEMDAGNPAAAAEAKGKAIACYLAYRRDGGENHDAPGRIALAVTQSLLAGDPAQAALLLQQLAAEPDAAWLLPFIYALQAIVAGGRDRSLAAAPELHYTMAAEILLLIETLEKAGNQRLE